MSLIETRVKRAFLNLKIESLHEIDRDLIVILRNLHSESEVLLTCFSFFRDDSRFLKPVLTDTRDRSLVVMQLNCYRSYLRDVLNVLMNREKQLAFNG